MLTTVAALYIDKNGPYWTIPGVDCYDVHRDATRYQGPHPVVAHPACGPWGKLRTFCRHQDPTHGPIGVDQVLRWGGVLEHPKGSLLWDLPGYELPKPGEPAKIIDGRTVWTIEVDQVRWGHEARKRTWLLLVDVNPDLVCDFPPDREPTRTVQSRKHLHSHGTNRLPEMSTHRRKLTPPAFADWLVLLARSVPDKE